MVDAGVEAEFLHGEIAFLPAAGDAHGACAFRLRELADDSADRTRCGGYDERASGLRRDDVIDAIPCRDARHAERADKSLQGHAGRIDLAQVLAVGQRIKLPAAVVRHDLVAHGEIFVPGGNDLAGGSGDHHVVDLLARGVGFRLVHAPAHIGIERHPEVLHEHLAVRRLACFFREEAEIAFLRLALRTRSQHEALVHRHRLFSLMLFRASNAWRSHKKPSSRGGAKLRRGDPELPCGPWIASLRFARLAMTAVPVITCRLIGGRPHAAHRCSVHK